MLEKHEDFFTQKLHFYRLDHIAPYNDQISVALNDYDLIETSPGKNGQPVRLGARQTPPTLLDRTDDPFPLLKSTWHSIIEKMERRPVVASNAWGVLMNKKDCQAPDSVIQVPHDHHPWHWSAVYYVKVPKSLETGREGAIIFNNPLPYHYSEGKRVTPAEGLLIVFPSYMLHAIEHFSSDGERVSISLNAIFLPS